MNRDKYFTQQRVWHIMQAAESPGLWTMKGLRLHLEVDCSRLTLDFADRIQSHQKSPDTIKYSTRQRGLDTTTSLHPVMNHPYLVEAVECTPPIFDFGMLRMIRCDRYPLGCFLWNFILSNHASTYKWPYVHCGHLLPMRAVRSHFLHVMLRPLIALWQSSAASLPEEDTAIVRFAAIKSGILRAAFRAA